MIPCTLGRIVLRDGEDSQYIYLAESGGQRGFPIVIGWNEVQEIRRVVHDSDPLRPLTHRLAYDVIEALNASIKHVDIVDLKDNTFFAQLVLQNDAGDELAVVDSRPSDAIALALRARCPIRVAESVMKRAAPDAG
ncbi:MAG: bifunctional nuclease family protein [Planctomycetota bacterium]